MSTILRNSPNRSDLPAAQTSALASLVRPAFFLLGMVWASTTAFAVLTPLPVVGQVAPVLLAGMFCVVALPALLGKSLQNFAVVALALHVAAAIVSSLISDPERMYIASRYILLWIVMAIFVAIRLRGQVDLYKLRMGMAYGALVYLIYNALFIDFSAAMTATAYRAGTSHPNHVGAIAATAALTFMAEFLRRTNWWSPKTLWLAACCGICAGVLILTKSRTSLVALIVGLSVLWWLQSLATKIRLIVIASLLLMLSVAAFSADFYTELYDSLTDSRRDLTTAAGRMIFWEYGLLLVQEAPLLGHGPGADEEIFDLQFNNANCHNGLLGNLINVGILGTLPLIYILARCFGRMPSLRVLPDYHWSLAMIICVCTISLAESLFFSIGIPAGLLFLCAIADVSCASAPELSGAALMGEARESGNDRSAPSGA